MLGDGIAVLCCCCVPTGPLLSCSCWHLENLAVRSVHCCLSLRHGHTVCSGPKAMAHVKRPQQSEADKCHVILSSVSELLPPVQAWQSSVCGMRQCQMRAQLWQLGLISAPGCVRFSKTSHCWAAERHMPAVHYERPAIRSQLLTKSARLLPAQCHGNAPVVLRCSHSEQGHVASLLSILLLSWVHSPRRVLRYAFC